MPYLTIITSNEYEFKMIDTNRMLYFHLMNLKSVMQFLNFKVAIDMTYEMSCSRSSNKALLSVDVLTKVA